MYLEYQASIYDVNQADTTPADLSTLVPGGEGFVPGSRDALKNFVGFLIASCGWELVAQVGTEPSTWVLKTVGVSGFDLLFLQLSYDTNMANLLVQMGTNYTTSLVNASPVTTWPLTNGATSGVNSPRGLTVYVYGDKDSVSLVSKESTYANYATAIGPVGILKRWAAVTPTGANQVGKDYTALFMALPSRFMSIHSSNSMTMTPITVDHTAVNRLESSSTYAGPTANYSGNHYGANVWIGNAVLVYQNYGDSTANWIPNFLASTGQTDTNSTDVENVATFSTNKRIPLYNQPTYGIDGKFYLAKERVFQLRSVTDTNPKLRGLLPCVAYVGTSGVGDLGEITCDNGEVYKRIAVNLGFWPRLNPKGFGLRKA